MLRLHDLWVGYQGKPVLPCLNLSATNNELVALIGQNGAGKSTLMRTIARLQPAISGNIELDSRPINQYTRNDLARRISFASTEQINISHLTVRKFVSMGRFPYTNWIGNLKEDDHCLIEKSIQMVNIKHLENRNLYEISDGERQRAMIARTLAQDTPLILLDEPTAFLDMPNRYEIIRLLHQLTKKSGKTIVFSTHDLNIAMQEADKLWLIAGDTVYEGAPEDLILNHTLNRVFEGTKLHFDDIKGTFEIEALNETPITLTGEGKAYLWTKRALERLGYSIHKTFNGNHVEVMVSDEGKISWLLYEDTRKINVASIYELSKYLLKINPVQ